VDVIEIKLTNTLGNDFYLIIEGDKITPKEIWEQRETWMKRVADSKEIFEAMEPERQQAINRMLQSAIERMHDRSEEWIPEGLDVKGGDYVDLHIRLLFTDIDREIERHEQATSFQIRSASEELQETLQEFEPVETIDG
jgi:hypothetical protein